MKSLVPLALTLAMFLAPVWVGSADARGNSPAKLARAGWLCVNAGPNALVHCFPPGAFQSTASVSVKVFDTTDVESDDAHFLGTELLIRADLYEGQPCAQNGGEYELLPASVTGLPADYRACHHYAQH